MTARMFNRVIWDWNIYYGDAPPSTVERIRSAAPGRIQTRVSDGG
jgi:hypothetical protein